MDVDGAAQQRRELKNRAIGLLARREHSAAELRLKLAAAAPSELLEAVLVELAAANQQSDARFAEALVRSLIGRGQGPLRVRQALTQKGVAPELAQQALAEVAVDWFAQAEAVQARRFGSALPASPKERARQIRFLLYRGFNQDQVNHALEQARQRAPELP